MKPKKYILVRYDVFSQLLEFHELEHDAKNLTLIDNTLIIVSTDNDNICIEKYDYETDSIICNRINTPQNALKKEFEQNTPCIVSCSDKNILLSLSSDLPNNQRVSTFLIEKENLKLLGMRKFENTDYSYYLYGLTTYVK